jgi:hypothetical protein
VDANSVMAYSEEVERVAAVWALLLSGLLFLIIICISIMLIRRDHAHHVHTLWYLFSFVLCFYSGVSLYIYSPNSTFDQFSLPGKALIWIVKVSTDVEGELYFVSSILVLVIVPHFLSFLVSGIFGCASPPIMVSTTTRVVILSLIKFFCVLSAIYASQSFVYGFTPPGETVLLHEHLGPSMTIRADYNALLMMSVSFAISAIYYKMDTLWRHVIDSSRLKYLNLALRYMMWYHKPNIAETVLAEASPAAPANG